MSSRVLDNNANPGVAPVPEANKEYLENQKHLEMPMIDRIILGPIKKYQKYNNFPWKMLIHIFLIIVATAQVVLVIGTSGGYSRSDQNVFYTLFMDEGMELEDPDVQRVMYLYNIEEFKNKVKESLDTYFGIEEESDDYFETYTLIKEMDYYEKEAKEQVIMDIFLLPGYDIKSTNDIRLVFTPDDYGIFGEEENLPVKQLLSNASHVQMTYLLQNQIPLGTVNNIECYDWEITQTYDFSNRNHLELRLGMEKSYCNLDRPLITNFWGRYIWLHLLCIILSSVSLFLNFKYILDIVQSFQKMKEKYKTLAKNKKSNMYRKNIKKILKKNKSDVSQRKTQTSKLPKAINSSDVYTPTIGFEDEEDDVELPNWNELKNDDKLKLFSRWSIVTICGDILLIMGSVFLIFNTKTVNQKGEIIIGFGAMLTWISLMKFYENVKGYNMIANTIENAFEIVFKALTGIMPVFIGYGVLGTCIFWRSHRFTSVSTSLFSLFSVMNGDMIFDCWHDIDTVDFLLAQLYLYTFIFFSICVVFNTFIVIIEDGYIMGKFFDRTDWVKGVNQRSSLHTAEYLMREKGANAETGGGDTTTQSPEKSFDKQRTNSIAQSIAGQGGRNLQIPLIHGVPIPHDGDPFIRLQKKTKKDIKSRKALIKMLRHEKKEILLNRKLRNTSMDVGESTKELDLTSQNDTDKDRSIHDPTTPGLPNVSQELQETPANTPEAVARKILELMVKFDKMKSQEINEAQGQEDAEGLIDDINQRYKFNFERIQGYVQSYADKY